MNRLEFLLEQKCTENKLEDFLVYYSTSIGTPLKPIEPSFNNISAYADSLNKQFGISSTAVNPRIPSLAPTAKTFSPLDIVKSLNKPYKPSVSEEELAYANNLNKQFNIPSTVLKPSTPSSTTNPQAFDPNPVIDAVKNPICPSLGNKPPTISSTPVKHNIYQNHELTQPLIECPTLKLKPIPINNTGLEKEFYDDFKKEHEIRISGFKKIKPVYNLFKKNEFPTLYNKFSKGLRLKKSAIKIITFTNPLKDEDDISPSYTPWKKELRLPAIKPRIIPFDNLSQKEYNKMLNNAFLPHELGHAKIEDEYSKYYPDIDIDNPGLKGFHEHLADAFALDSVKNTPQLFNTITERIKFENNWVTPKPIPSKARENYDEFLSDKEDTSLIPGKQATINMLNEPVLKQKYESTLRNVLDFKYYDDPHKEIVYNNLNKLSNLYQKQAIKLINISKRNSIFSDFKTKKILSTVEKETFRFIGDL